MTLPITSYKEAIIEAVANHYVTIVTAETGSGKTTQIPQYLAEHYEQVIVTQPRIMAAKTGARRVAEEMGVTLGEEVGYKTGYDKCFSDGSKILFCTDGLQVVKTILDRDVTKRNVLIIDEVHEWNINIETLVAWCKFMQGKWNTKVVIMSATLDAEKLAKFFGDDSSVLNVPGTLYDVEVEEYVLMDPTVAFISHIKEAIHTNKNTLVFVPGKKEISETMEKLKGEHAVVLPLHGELDWEAQKKCFASYRVPKVVVATNVAQTSITIPDIDVVVDTGKARISIAENGIQGLFLRDISQADIMQRKGRAGRTKNGKYILCSDSLAIRHREEFPVPEIQRSILDRVILQLASIGIDAEMLEFYHQPSKDAIITAKKVLSYLGAMDDNGKVTEIGQKMVKMPVSVQLARMIVEAEKYGVTEPVMTIAAITEIGGLLGDRVYRELIDGKWYSETEKARYSDFTEEKDSDLLAELDVWNKITKIGYIDFESLGIRKKNFFRIKEHLKKLKEALYGIVEMSNNDDREAILKSCLFGMASHIYAKSEYGKLFMGEDNITRSIDKRSCVRADYCSPIHFVVGIPRTIEIEGEWRAVHHLELISFASKVSPEMIFELAPNRINEKTELQYSVTEDAVRVITTKTFLGRELRTESHLDYQHPQYEQLKDEYEELKRKEEERREEQAYWNSWRREEVVDTRQKTVVIGGKTFSVSYTWDNKAKVYIDTETLFTTDEREVLLENGTKVYVSAGMSMREDTSLVALRNMLENKRIRRLHDSLKYQYESLKVTTLKDAVNQKSKLGEVELTMDRGGYGTTPIFVYGYLSLKKNTVSFDVTSDKELANSNTIEALQHLFMKEVAKKYGENKFSHQPGKKKKVLTDSEKRMKEDFDSLVRACLRSLTVENALDNMEFLEEYYQELMAK